MRILVTGSSGFLGHSLVDVFSMDHELRLMDIHEGDSSHETFIGDVSKLEDCRAAVAGMDAVVIAHMAPRPIVFPETSFDSTVKGTANLFFAAEEAGIKRVCLISSVNTVRGYPDHLMRTADTPMRGVDIYDLSKICQEIIAEQYYRTEGMSVVVLRIGYVVDAEELTNKYEVQLDRFVEGMIDRGDVGRAVLKSLQLSDAGYEILYLIGEERSQRYDVVSSWERLAWMPRHLVEMVDS